MALCPVILLADRSRPNVEKIASLLADGLSDVALFLPEEDEQLSNATLAIAIGGDGTLINHGRNVSAYQIPLIGVNSGYLGFLAKFDAASLIEHRRSIFTSEAPTMDVMLLGVAVDGHSPEIAMNEAMIAAGSPFRILELGLAINDVPAPSITRGWHYCVHPNWLHSTQCIGWRTHCRSISPSIRFNTACCTFARCSTDCS